MQKKLKLKYVSCELKVVEFCVERGFAQASTPQTVGAFTNAVNTQEWTMGREEGKGFRNKDAQYGTMEVGGWFE